MSLPTADRLKGTSEYYFSRKLEEIARLRAGGLDVINLGIGSPDLAPAPAVVERAGETLHRPDAHGYASYRSTPELREAMAAWYARTYRVTLDPKTQVLPLLGSKEGILYSSLAFLNPGDGVLVPDPGYPAYAAVARLIGARPQTYELSARNGWLPNFDELAKLDLRGVRLMWVNYPHMPTGAEGTDGLFVELVTFARKHGIRIVNDNPYGLVLNEKPPRSLLAFEPGFEHVLELNSLSKSFNLAGWRVGMALGAKSAIDAILQVKSNVDSGMFLAVQAGAAAALALDDAWHAERNREYARRRKIVEAVFTSLGFRFAPGQVGLFTWAEAPAGIDDVEAFLDEVLAEAHVFITPGFIFGSNGRRFARISLCATTAALNLALKRIEAFVERRQGRQA